MGALLVFDLAFWFFAVRPLSDREAEQAAVIAALHDQIRVKSESVEDLRVAAGLRDNAGGTGDQLLDELTFDRRSAFSQLLGALNEAARYAEVEIRETNYQADEVEGNASYGMVSISANFRGRYENLVKFLNLLDRSDAFLIVERLGAAPREDTGELQITMRIDTFVRNVREL